MRRRGLCWQILKGRNILCCHALKCAAIISVVPAGLTVAYFCRLMFGAASRWMFYLLLVLVVAGCANIVPPEGGKKDVTPPKLRSISPADSQLNTRVKKIELAFDEYITLNEAATQVQISPLLSIPLTVTASLRRVTVLIPDSLLLDATTYRITFGTAIRDLHEGNVWGSNGYTFSTGGHFDSLSLDGSVYDARTGLHDSTAQVLLYDASEGDSSIVRHKPLYVMRVNAAGDFLFQGLPARPFRIYALRDANANLTFDGGAEWIAFSDSVITPTALRRANLELRTFPETLGDTTIAATTGGGGLGRRASPSGPAVATASKGSYIVGVDTTDIKRRSQDLDAPVKLNFGRKLSAPINEGKIFLSYDSSGTLIETPFSLSVADTTGLQYNLKLVWREDAVYTLRLQKGFAKDSSGADLLPGRYTFRTKRDEDYGKLRVHLPSKFYGRSHILQVSGERDTIYQQPVTDTIVSLVHVPPGVYTMRVIEDKNENGRWDAGDLFLRRQPELVIPYSNTINLKAGWEQQIDFDVPRKRGLGGLSDR